MQFGDPSFFPTSSTTLASVLPVGLDTFFASYFNREMLKLNHTVTGLDPSKLWPRSQFAEDLAAIAADGRMHKGGMCVAPHDKNKRRSNYTFEWPGHNDNITEAFEDAIANKNISFTIKYEYVSAERRPLRWLSDALFDLIGIPVSVHLYASAPGSQVLDPHTDPYDVLVWQVKGRKSWRACVPRQEIAAGKGGADLTDAQRCLLQELAKDSIEGCTPYTTDDTHSLVCDDFTMAPGDVLYMPKGVVHYADTDPNEEAFHLTIGIHRQNLQWIDVVHHLLHSGAKAQPLPDGERRQGLLEELMQVYSETAEGVHLHEFVPGWLLACHRPWRKRTKDDEYNVTTDPECIAKETELKRLYRWHVARLSDWTFRQAQQGPWKLAHKVAENEKKAGELVATNLEAMDHLFWWDGDLSFLKWIQPDGTGRLEDGLDHVGSVTDFHNTTAFRWARRVKGSGSGKGGVQREFGEPPPSGTATLCDEMTGWQRECKGSDSNTCEVFVNKPTTCDDYCASQGDGVWCAGSWDDVKETCARMEMRGRQAPVCSARRSSQICMCRRECADEGPWACHEEGCPARTVTCDILSVACKARFSDIWRKAPYGVGSRLVSQACPMSCGKCNSQREDAPPVKGKKPTFGEAVLKPAMGKK